MPGTAGPAPTPGRRRSSRKHWGAQPYRSREKGMGTIGILARPCNVPGLAPAHLRQLALHPGQVPGDARVAADGVVQRPPQPEPRESLAGDPAQLALDGALEPPGPLVVLR